MGLAHFKNVFISPHYTFYYNGSLIGFPKLANTFEFPQSFPHDGSITVSNNEYARLIATHLSQLTVYGHVMKEILSTHYFFTKDINLFFAEPVCK